MNKNPIISKAIDTLLKDSQKLFCNFAVATLASNLTDAQYYDDFYKIDYIKYAKKIIEDSRLSPSAKEALHQKFNSNINVSTPNVPPQLKAENHTLVTKNIAIYDDFAQKTPELKKIIYCTICNQPVDENNRTYLSNHPYHCSCIECMNCHKKYDRSEPLNNFIQITPKQFLCNQHYKEYIASQQPTTEVSDEKRDQKDEELNKIESKNIIEEEEEEEENCLKESLLKIQNESSRNIFEEDENEEIDKKDDFVINYSFEPINDQNLKTNKFIALQNAKKEIFQIENHFQLYNNLDFPINIEQIKEESCKNFLQSTKADPNDNRVISILKDIKRSINEQYAELLNKLNLDLYTFSSWFAIERIIQIIENPDKDMTSQINDFDITESNDIFDLSNLEYNSNQIQSIQQKINKVLDDYPNDLLFGKRKLRNISNTKISEILASLKGIQKNPQLKICHFENRPKINTLLSNSTNADVKSLSNILTNNCFFVTLYGRQSCTRNVLSSLTNKSLYQHQIGDLVTVYGPLSIASFTKNIPDSFDKLKQFNVCPLNLFFFEITSDENESNQKYINWCKYASFISHFIIYCSETAQNENEIQKFRNNLLSESSNSFVINCSPSQLQFPINFDYISLDSVALKNSIFQKLIEQIDQFIPHETAERYGELFKSQPASISNEKSKFKDYIIKDYSIHMMNKSTDDFLMRKDQLFNYMYSMIKTNQDKNIDLNEKYNYFLEKAQEFLFVNTYQNLWQQKAITDIAVILNNDISQKLNSSMNEIHLIEQIRKLIKIKPSNTTSFSSESNSILQEINKLCENKETYSTPNSPQEIDELYQKLEKKFNELVHSEFEQQSNTQLINVISNELFNYLNENPTASDEEYSKFYNSLYEKYSTSDSDEVIHCFQYVTYIRNVIPKYKHQSFIIQLDKTSFERANVPIKIESINYDLTQDTTTHELYQIVSKLFNLTNIPFYIAKTIYNKDSDYPVQSEIFDDEKTKVFELDSSIFTVVYNTIKEVSTASFLNSMVVRKEIKISNEFVIHASTEEADFKVTYDKDTSGLIDTPFNITTSNAETSFGEDKGILAFVKLNANEISTVKEGNAIVHKSYQGNQWINEEDDVYLSYPDCTTAAFLVRHCSEHKICFEQSKADSLIPPQYQDTRYTREWEGFKKDFCLNYQGRPYYVPVGFQGFGIKVSNFKENTCVGFHGTKAKNVSNIISNGFSLPSQSGGVRKGHFSLNQSPFGISNFADAIFVSPSIKYASLYSDNRIFMRTQGRTFVASGHIEHNKIRLIVLQCRVNPGAIQEFPSTAPFDVSDEHFTNMQMEWRIANPNDIFPYRLLVKYLSPREFLSMCQQRSKSDKIKINKMKYNQ